jgi:hypothetical protein
VTAVVDDDAASRERAERIPASAHVDHARKIDLEADGLADRTVRDHRARRDEIRHVPELRGEDELTPYASRRAEHTQRGAHRRRERLFAEHVQAPLETGDRDGARDAPVASRRPPRRASRARSSPAGRRTP